ncbi:hypothetical protein KBA63_00975 [Candidatus Woesebacteria bacterium]|nr:hypothetical protein [Candidatus Woesebacteria bacterium]MBP9687214.1 hypothetical protein [Candidatus Woesebacteria bacterium]
MAHFHIPRQKKKRIVVVEEVSYIAVALGIIMTVPQIMTIWIEKKVDGVSIVTWISYSLLTVFWIYYGVLHKEKPIIIGNILGLLVNIAIVTGVLLFR